MHNVRDEPVRQKLTSADDLDKWIEGEKKRQQEMLDRHEEHVKRQCPSTSDHDDDPSSILYVLVDGYEKPHLRVVCVATSIDNAIKVHDGLYHPAESDDADADPDHAKCVCRIYRAQNVFAVPLAPPLWRCSESKNNNNNNNNDKAKGKSKTKKEKKVEKFLLYDGVMPEVNDKYNKNNIDDFYFKHAGIVDCLGVFDTQDLAIAYHNANGSKDKYKLCEVHHGGCACSVFKINLDEEFDIGDIINRDNSPAVFLCEVNKLDDDDDNDDDDDDEDEDKKQSE